MDAMAVVEHDLLTVAAGRPGHQYGAIGGSADRLAHGAGDIDASMEGAFTIEGVLTFAEGTGEGPSMGHSVGRSAVVPQSALSPEPKGGSARGACGRKERNCARR